MLLHRASYLRDRAGMIHIRCWGRYPGVRGTRCEPHFNQYDVDELEVVTVRVPTCLCCVVSLSTAMLRRFTGV